MIFPWKFLFLLIFVFTFIMPLLHSVLHLLAGVCFLGAGWRAVLDAWLSSGHHDAHGQFHGLPDVLRYGRRAGGRLTQ